jgi:hypothetical protein
VRPYPDAGGSPDERVIVQHFRSAEISPSEKQGLLIQQA